MTNNLKQSAAQTSYLISQFLFSLKLVVESRFGFCAAVALLMSCLRLVSFDYQAFFELQSIPNHDMYQGASFFTTSMHSMRLSGEIAWWNPISFHHGYAQYYQSLLSPLAPTQHHIVFILWAQFIYLLNLLRIQIPEYFQYLTVNYIILPFLTFFSFSLFVSYIFRHRATILFVVIIYTFSGIGVWNSAWFYFQESFSLFFVLATIIGVLQRPSIQGLSLTLVALIIQLTSINYWTVYNSWFLVIILITYFWFHLSQVRKFIFYAQTLFKNHKVLTRSVAILLMLVLTSWLLIIGSTVLEQSGNYIRSSVGEQGGYSIELAQGLVEYRSIHLLGTFDSTIPSKQDVGTLGAHAARYIGAFLLPLLCLVPVYSWRQREKWLIASFVAVWTVCLAPPFLLAVWKVSPFMDRLIHLFYFYSHFGQILLVLAAGLAMEKLLYHRLSSATKLRFLIVLSCITFLGVILLLGHNFFRFSPRSSSIFVLTGVLCLQVLLTRISKGRGFIIALLILICLTDMTSYFWQASRYDQKFTADRSFSGNAIPLPANVQSAFRKPWSFSIPPSDFETDLFKNMPISNDFWPRNGYLVHRSLFSIDKFSQDVKEKVMFGRSLDFYTSDQVVLGSLSAEQLKSAKSYPKVLSLQGRRAKKLLDASQLQRESAVANQFSYQWQGWQYNTFSFTVNSSQDGWLLIRQLYDPIWKLTVDGKPAQAVQANFIGMATSMKAGQHTVQMDYRPLARSLYWPASFLLEIVLLILLFIAIRSGTVSPDLMSNRGVLNEC